MPRILKLAGYTRSAHRLAYSAEIAGHTFTTRFRYDSIDLLELERRHGEALVRTLYFHAIAFDLNRLVSLEPDAVDFGPFSDLATTDFLELWQAILQGVWAQWRYENGLPDYSGPKPLGTLPRPRAPAPTSYNGKGGRAQGPPLRSLLFCGGGKDSLLAAKLFEEIGEPYESFAYSHSIYGAEQSQHELIDRLLDHCTPQARHRLSIDDDFLDSDLDLELFGVTSVSAAETPSGLFLALPLALAHGFENLVVAHERSADLGNLVWEATGEEINHQWGKSLEAEALLGDYVERHLLPGVRYFSVLKPVADPVIFAALGDHLEAIPDTHSCNRAKPWCRRCAKCVYVFLGYAAWLPRRTVLETFDENLFEVEENLGWFARLLGLEDHLPFECVGQVEESRLFLKLAAERGWKGAAIERFARAVQDLPADAAHFEVSTDRHRIPETIAQRVLSELEKQATRVRTDVETAPQREGARPSPTTSS